jgi:hypothetical protein
MAKQNRTSKWIELFSLSLLITVLFLNTGCLAKKSALEVSTTISRTIASTGTQLYDNKCSSCHGPLENSQKIGRTFTQIKSSIGSIQEMTGASLLSLTDQEIQLISDVLDIPIPPSSSQTLQFKQILGGRRFLISKFKELFLGEGSSQEEIQINTIIDALKNEAGFLGGKATHYEIYTSPSIVDKQEDADALVHPSASVPRRGLITKACQEILSFDDAVENVLLKSGLSESSLGDEANIGHLFTTINPTVTINSSVSSTLINIYSQAVNNQKLTNKEAWKFVIYTLCVAPTFELF